MILPSATLCHEVFSNCSVGFNYLLQQLLFASTSSCMEEMNKLTNHFPPPWPKNEKNNKKNLKQAQLSTD